MIAVSRKVYFVGGLISTTATFSLAYIFVRTKFLSEVELFFGVKCELRDDNLFIFIYNIIAFFNIMNIFQKYIVIKLKD